MTAIDTTKARIDVTNTALSHRLSEFAKYVGPLRDASQRHDGKMTPPAVMLHDQLDHGARFSLE